VNVEERIERMPVQSSEKTTKILKVTFHKKKTDILRRKPFELSEAQTRTFRRRDPWGSGR
jgi:hypothetical protein